MPRQFRSASETHAAARCTSSSAPSMVPFAGYEMPVQYPGRHPQGASAHARAQPGLFDVSHMGQVASRPIGRRAHAARALERWCRQISSASSRAGSATRFLPIDQAASSMI